MRTGSKSNTALRQSAIATSQCNAESRKELGSLRGYLRQRLGQFEPGTLPRG